jgi:hypothetical protein
MEREVVRFNRLRWWLTRKDQPLHRYDVRRLEGERMVRAIAGIKRGQRRKQAAKRWLDTINAAAVESSPMTYHIDVPQENLTMANATLKTVPAKSMSCPHCKARWKLRTLSPLRCPRCSRRLAPR